MALFIILSFIVVGGNRSGNFNGTSLNNSGTNGNYWSSTINPNNTSNAYNLNVNSSNANSDNNNRNNGLTVRGV